MIIPTFDSRDQALLDERLAAWNATKGPRVGDFVIMPSGDILRFTHDWGDEIQTTCPEFKGDTSFYLGLGYTSFSGALDPAIAKRRLTETRETREGWFWFFHHNEQRAHNGVHFKAPCRVFNYA